MGIIQIESTRAPFSTPQVIAQALTALERAEAMGLLPANERIEKLDLPSFRKIVRHIQRAGIGRSIQLRDEFATSLDSLEREIKMLNTALTESPAPQFEWRRITEALGVDLLALLLDISQSSLHRYQRAARTTPDDVAERLHFLGLMIGDLRGAYNEIGIRQWFGRKRAQLGGLSPIQLLKPGWMPDEAGPRQVQELAHALTSSPAT